MSKEFFKSILLFFSRHIVSVLIEIQDVCILDYLFKRRSYFRFFAVIFNSYGNSLLFLHLRTSFRSLQKFLYSQISCLRMTFLLSCYYPSVIVTCAGGRCKYRINASLLCQHVADLSAAHYMHSFPVYKMGSFRHKLFILIDSLSSALCSLSIFFISTSPPVSYL